MVNKYPTRWTLVACMSAAGAVAVAMAYTLGFTEADTTAVVAIGGGAFTVIGTIAANLTTDAPGDSDVVKVVKEMNKGE